MPLAQREDRLVPFGWVKPHPRNVRTHPRRQRQKLKRIIQRLGLTTSLVVDENGVLIAGHLRLIVLGELGWEQVPVTVLSGLSEAEKRALMLADNRVAQDAGTDRAKLFDEVSDLRPLLIEDGVDLEMLGYEPAEIDQLVVDFEDGGDDPADAIDPVEEGRAVVSRPGDLFQIGAHRLLSGSALVEGDVAALMTGEAAAAVITDPPYNVKVASIGGRGRTRHPEFAQASGEMSPEAFTAFLGGALTLAAAASTPGAVHYVFMDWRHIGELVTAGRSVYDAMLNLIVWAKTNAGQGSFYRSQHELCGVFRVRGAPHCNNVELGRHGRNRPNVWRYPGANAFRAGRMDDLRDHPTVKPVAMLADAIKDCTRRDDIVLDPFAGSGSTLLAAERVGRRGYGIELEPRYVDVALRRLEAFTGRDAVHVESGLTFRELASERGIAETSDRPRPRRRKAS